MRVEGREDCWDGVRGGWGEWGCAVDTWEGARFYMLVLTGLSAGVWDSPALARDADHSMAARRTQHFAQIARRVVEKKQSDFHQSSVLALPTFSTWTSRSNWLIDDEMFWRNSGMFDWTGRYRKVNLIPWSLLPKPWFKNWRRATHDSFT